jgi:branched-chain amino acid transport system permease protein
MLGKPTISIVMATIGLSIFLQALMKWMFGVFAQPFPHIFLSGSVSILGIEMRTVYLFSMAASAVIMAGFAYFFRFTRYGLAMRATAYDQQVAQSLGVSVKHAPLAWAISATVSAVAGMVAGVVNGVSSGLSFFGIKVFPAVILGGLDRLSAQSSVG